MNQEHFLTELKIQLKPLQPQQAAYILQTYRETFATRLADGETETMISKDLGSPQAIAADILKDFKVENTRNINHHDEWQEFTAERQQEDTPFNYYHANYQKRPEKSSFFIRFCQISAILAVNLLFMIWFIFAGVMVLLSLWLVTLILVASPILGLIVFVSSTGAYAILQLSVSLILGGLGLIGLAIMLPCTRYTLRFLKSYTRWTFNTLRGRY